MAWWSTLAAAIPTKRLVSCSVRCLCSHLQRGHLVALHTLLHRATRIESTLTTSCAVPSARSVEQPHQPAGEAAGTRAAACAACAVGRQQAARSEEASGVVRTALPAVGGLLQHRAVGQRSSGAVRQRVHSVVAALLAASTATLCGLVALRQHTERCGRFSPCMLCMLCMLTHQEAAARRVLACAAAAQGKGAQFETAVHEPQGAYTG